MILVLKGQEEAMAQKDLMDSKDQRERVEIKENQVP